MKYSIFVIIINLTMWFYYEKKMYNCKIYMGTKEFDFHRQDCGTVLYNLFHKSE